MKSRLQLCFLVLLLFGFGTAGATVFNYELTGIVESISDGVGNPVALPGASAGDTMVATMTFDAADFGDGVDVTGDGLDYAAPAGLEMTFEFSSSGVYTRGIDYARARDTTTSDQWSWGLDNGGSFQVADLSGGSFTAPLPLLFEDMLDIFIDNLSSFTGGLVAIELNEPSSELIVVELSDSGRTLSILPAAVPVPATLGLLALGFIALIRRHRTFA